MTKRTFPPRIVTYVDQEVKDEVQEMAEEEDRTESQMTSVLIREAIKARKERAESKPLTPQV